MTRSVSFFVRGTPVTQGSKRLFVNPHTGKPSATESGGDKLRLWRHAISDEARKAVNGGEGPLEGPVAVSMAFWLPKPSSAPKRRRTWPVAKRSGDVDKLARAGIDAMTGVIYGDDAQIISLGVTKDFEDHKGVGVWIAVGEITE